MNTISILSTTDLPAARQIEQRAPCVPWSEKKRFSGSGANGISA
ncbi:ribosomal-protein-alanine acetyltransferase [Salmonella enterica subsp. enterica]|nr:ribosomal-protein-alanine acetyltransferase [Salmonella enterica subsp. enterica]